jgi:hypothetical protein
MVLAASGRLPLKIGYSIGTAIQTGVWGAVLDRWGALCAHRRAGGKCRRALGIGGAFIRPESTRFLHDSSSGSAIRYGYRPFGGAHELYDLGTMT